MAKQLLTIRQVSAQTGMSIKTLYKWVADKKIPYIYLNGNIRFEEQKIDNWIANKEVRIKTA